MISSRLEKGHDRMIMKSCCLSTCEKAWLSSMRVQVEEKDCECMKEVALKVKERETCSRCDFKGGDWLEFASL